MKALHVGKFYPPPYGGIESHLVSLLHELNKEMHTDAVVAHQSFAWEEIELDGYTVTRLPSLGVVASTSICPTMGSWLRDRCRSEDVDIVHIHLPNPMAHLATLFLPKTVKLVLSWHSDIIRQNRLMRLYQPFLDSLLNRADAIVGATPYHFSSSTQLEKCNDRSKWHVVPYGIDGASFVLNDAVRGQAHAIREKYGRRQIIFGVGRHIYYKGFDFLIRAMSDIHDAVLLLAGEGPLTDQYRRTGKEWGVTDRVFFVGTLSRSQLVAHYHASDVFCLPSINRSEAFGIVMAEAMLCKKPVVSTDLRNGATYVNRHNETGFVVPPNDHCALANALNRLLMDDVMRESFGAAGFEWVSSQFTLEKMREAMLALYSKICNLPAKGFVRRQG